MSSYFVYHCQTGFSPKVVSSHTAHSEAAAERDRLNAEEREANGGKLDGGHHYECDDKILEQYIAYDPDMVIWGHGVGEDAALADARDWIGRNADQEEAPGIINSLVTIRATDELCQRVEDLGGQIDFEFDHDQYGEFAR